MRIAVAVSLLLAAAPAIAADPPKGDPDARVCREIKNTGSRISAGRECHSRSEWAEIEAARRKQYEQFNQNMNRGAAAAGPVSNSPSPR